jgi:hypothetical protein
MIASLDENNAMYVQESEFKLLTKGRAHLTGKNLEEDNRLAAAASHATLKPSEIAEYSRQQPGWHVFVLSVFTFSIYNVYWFYKSLNLLNAHSSVQTSNTPASPAAPTYFCQEHPFFSTFLFLIPVVNLIIGMQFFALVGQLLPDKNSFWHKNSLLCAFALALAFGALFLFSVLPEPYFLFYLLNALPLAFVQSALNRHWEVVEQDNLVVRAAFNPIELVVIFFGAGLLGLCAVGPSITPHNH